MKLSTGIIFCFLILGISSQRWGTFLKEAGQSEDQRMGQGSQPQRFRQVLPIPGNYDATQRGPGSTWAAKIVTDLSKNGDSGYGWEDSRADQFANEWDRSGEDPNHCRLAGQPLASTKLY
uniref:Serum amyloid A protein n=1 Tax=Bos mutus grunniens TaxID=30521 RepID=A0A8B9XCF8_BOSMU